MIITVSGLPGCGKTTVCKLLAEKLGFEHISAGEIFRNNATKKGMTLEEFGEYALKHPDIDKELDKNIVEAAKKDNIIIEGRLAGLMLDRANIKCTKVWLDAPLKVRGERIANREGISFTSAIAEIQKREKCEWDRYYNTYSINLNDLSSYTRVIDTSNITPEEVVSIILKEIEKSSE